MDIELLIEKRIEQIALYHNGSDLSIKKACVLASQVVGSYSGATEVIAKRTKRSVSSVENWAHAFRLYKSVRSNGHLKQARELWRVLPASHWWLAYDIQQAGYDAFYYLQNAGANEWSGRDMLSEYKRDKESGAAPLVFKHACHSFYSLANELSKSKKLTPRQRKAVEEVKAAFEV